MDGINGLSIEEALALFKKNISSPELDDETFFNELGTSIEELKKLTHADSNNSASVDYSIEINPQHYDAVWCFPDAEKKQTTQEEASEKLTLSPSFNDISKPHQCRWVRIPTEPFRGTIQHDFSSCA